MELKTLKALKGKYFGERHKLAKEFEEYAKKHKAEICPLNVIGWIETHMVYRDELRNEAVKATKMGLEILKEYGLRNPLPIALLQKEKAIYKSFPDDDKLQLICIEMGRVQERIRFFNLTEEDISNGKEK